MFTVRIQKSIEWDARMAVSTAGGFMIWNRRTDDRKEYPNYQAG